MSGKNPAKPILQFTVTPPRQSGPSEAERKIEALTQQLEEEFEKEEESEYFGKPTCLCFYFVVVLNYHILVSTISLHMILNF